MNKFIEQKIIELQNSKTATEITQNAKYFVNILAENERLTKQLENAVVLPCKVGDTFYGIQGEKTGVYAIFEYPCQKIIINKKSIFLATVYSMEFELDKWAFLTKSEAEARLAELKGKSNGGN